MAATALAAGTGLAAYPALSAEGLDRLVAAGGIAGLAILAVALARGQASALAWGLVGIGGEYAAWVALRGGDVDTRSPIFAAGLYAVAELSYWSLDRRSHAWPDRELEVRRLIALLTGCALVLAVGALLLGISTASVGGGIGVEALGIACAAAVFVLLARLARSEPRDEHEF